MSRSRFPAGVALLCITLFSASASASQPDPAPPTATETLLERAARRVGKTEAEVIARLGAPLARTVDPGFNRHERNAALELVSLHYRGLVVDLVRVPTMDKWMLSRIVMTDALWADRIDTPVPRTRRAAERTLGVSAHADPHLLTFRSTRATDPGADTFGLVLDGEHAVAWVFTYWID